MAEPRIDENGLPVYAPGDYDFVRVVDRSTGASRNAFAPEVTAAARAISAALDGLVADAREDIEAIIRDLGYLAPVPYASGLNVNDIKFTVSYDGDVYAPKPELVPFTTGAWNPAQWNVIQGDTNLRSDLADPTGGAGLVAFRQDGAGAVTRFILDKLRDSVSVKDFGADASASAAVNTAAFKAALATGKSVHVPGDGADYQINEPLPVSANFQEVYGDGSRSRVRNVGTGPAFYVTGQYVKFRNLSVFGSGGSFGAGASGTYGFHLHGARAGLFDNVVIRYHGSHGIYGTGGVWQVQVTSCEIIANGGDGINLVSPSGADSDQNGNGCSIIGSKVSLNNLSGINWKAASIAVVGCTIEANKQYGFRTDNTGLTNSAFGIGIVGNYFENNVLGEVSFVSVAGSVISGAEITGNYFYSISTGPTAFITFAGPIRSNLGVFIAGNSCVLGGTVANLVNGGETLREDCTIIPGAYQTVAVGYAKLLLGSRTKVLLGAWAQKGLTWADPSGPSENFFPAATVPVFFDLGLSQGDLLWDIKFRVSSNTTSQFTADAYIFSSDPTSGTAPTAVYSASLQSSASGGDHLFTVAPAVSNKPIRLVAGQKLYLRLRFFPPGTGSSMQMHDPVVRYV